MANSLPSSLTHPQELDPLPTVEPRSVWGRKWWRLTYIDISLWSRSLNHVTYVVAAELGAGIAALERVQRSSLSVLALCKRKFRELSSLEGVQDTHSLLLVPLLVLVGHDTLMHDTGVIELYSQRGSDRRCRWTYSSSPFGVLGDLFGE